ncbi:Uncharacterised protein [Mycobacterium tuberculosis]|nr:Uncharacterised protein [Mycobacterium tuberculosis]
MQEVKFLVVAFPSDPFEHHHVQRIGVADRPIKAEGFRPCCVKLRGGLRVSAGEQRYVVTQ